MKWQREGPVVVVVILVSLLLARADNSATTHSPATTAHPATTTASPTTSPSSSSTPTPSVPPKAVGAVTFLDDVVRCPQRKGNSTDNAIGGDHSSFRYPSTTILYSAIAVLSFVLFVVTLAKFDGIRMYAVSEREQSPSYGAQSSDAYTIDRKKARIASTDNRRWAAYFLAVFFQFATAAVLLQVPFFYENVEALRIGTLCVRVFLGASCVLLTMTLLHQRVYRTRDYAASSTTVNVKRERTGTIVLRVCVAFYVVYVGGEFVASHVVKVTPEASKILFWCYLCALVLISIPAVIATVWVCFHQAQVQPTRTAKGFALAGVLIHFLSMAPPSFWNVHVLGTWVAHNPCPLHYMSAFDVTLCITIVGLLLLFTFAVLEYKRNQLLMLEVQFKKYASGLNSAQASMRSTRLGTSRSPSNATHLGAYGGGGYGATSAMLNGSLLTDDSQSMATHKTDPSPSRPHEIL